MFRLVARVGCLRGGAIRLLEEWPHSPRERVDRTRLTDPLAFFADRRWKAWSAFSIWAVMTKQRRSNDWGFPRWRGYGSERDAARVRLCDREGCTEPGDCPAPKAPNRPERWYFCERHAAEYNRSWDYFQGLSAEHAKARAADEERDASGYRQAKHYAWGGPGDGSRSRDEMRALDVLEVDTEADFEEVKAAYRRLAKANHPDTNPKDAEAAARFQAVQAAYDVLRRAEERRAQLSP
jgi:hypothetical protein